MAQRDLPAHAFLPRQQATRGVAEEDHVDFVRLRGRVGQRRADGLGGERTQARIQEFAEAGHARPADHHLAHRAPPSVPSSVHTPKPPPVQASAVRTPPLPARRSA